MSVGSAVVTDVHPVFSVFTGAAVDRLLAVITVAGIPARIAHMTAQHVFRAGFGGAGQAALRTCLVERGQWCSVASAC